MPNMLNLFHALRICVVYLMLALPVLASAQVPALIGTWEGELVRGRENMTLAFTFTQEQGVYAAAFTSAAMGIYGMPAESVAVNGNKINIEIKNLDVVFYGTLRLSADGTVIKRIDGDYYQSSEMVPVVLKAVASPSR